MVKNISHADASAPTHATRNVPRASFGPSAHKQPLQQKKKKKAKKMKQNKKTTPRNGGIMLFCSIPFAFFFFSVLQLLSVRLRPSEARGTLCVAWAGRSGVRMFHGMPIKLRQIDQNIVEFLDLGLLMVVIYANRLFG